METQKDSTIDELLDQLYLSEENITTIMSSVKSKYPNKQGIDYIEQSLKVGQYRLHKHKETFSKMIYNSIDESKMKELCNNVIESELKNAVESGHVGDAGEHANMLGRKLTKEEIKTMGFRNLYYANSPGRVQSGMELLRQVNAINEIDRKRLIKYAKANYGRDNYDISDDWDGAAYALMNVANGLPVDVKRSHIKRQCI